MVSTQTSHAHQENTDYKYIKHFNGFRYGAKYFWRLKLWLGAHSRFFLWSVVKTIVTLTTVILIKVIKLLSGDYESC